MAGECMQHVTITVRLIRSFEHRNVKYLVFKEVDITQTTAQFMDHILQDLQIRPGIPPPLRKYKYDTFKMEYKAHGAKWIEVKRVFKASFDLTIKTSDPVINTENDEFILKPQHTLAEAGVENETELSFFKLEDYEAYKMNPLAGF